MIEELLYEALTALNVEVFPQIAPDNQKTPYLVYTLVLGTPKERPSGNIGSTKSRWQVDIYENSSIKAKKLRDRAIEKIRGFPHYSGDLSYRDGYVEKVKTYRQIIEFYTKEKNDGDCNNGN